jgi:metal-responsive CopG/Arc/MetJ family transcriptional regulator
MQKAYQKTSISLPKDVLTYLKAQSRREDGMPVSRLISRAVRQMMEAKKK